MKIAELFNEYFAKITDELELTENKSNLSFSENIEDPIDKAIQTCKSHPSIKEIRHQFSSQNRFEFRTIKTEDVSTQLKRLK